VTTDLQMNYGVKAIKRVLMIYFAFNPCQTGIYVPVAVVLQNLILSLI